MKYKVTRTDGTPIPEDEPCFVIRAQDCLALSAVEEYQKLLLKVNAQGDIVHEVERHRQRIREWQYNHGNKIPD